MSFLNPIQQCLDLIRACARSASTSRADFSHRLTRSDQWRDRELWFGMTEKRISTMCPEARSNRRSVILVSFTALAVLGFGLNPSSTIAQRPEANGVYTDKTGGQHPWNITSSHALIWDKQTYVPVGGTFAPRYLAEGQTDGNWAKDTEALGVLKARGMMDIIIDPVVSAGDVPATGWQKLVDHLEAGGFRYGISFGAGVKTRLTGIVVKPGEYRVGNLGQNVDPSWRVTDADSAKYVVVAPDGSQILQRGDVQVKNGFATVAINSTVTSGAVGVLYPRKTIAPNRDGFLPDLWAGFDAYRDKLLSVFSQVKFGTGLRFFLDPLAHPLAIQGEADYLVPDSPAFRLEWEAYLSQHYQGIDDLMQKWGLLEHDLKDYKQAAALVPLHSNRRGIAFMLNAATNSVIQLDANADVGRFWRDLRDCRDTSLSYYMRSAADFLKREIANVPVVYTYTEQRSMYTNSERSGGFDGLGIKAYARGSALVTGGADSAYSQAGESAKSMWLIVTETLDTNSPRKDRLGYASEQALFTDLDWLRGIGAKGFFVNGFQVLPEAAFANYQIIRAPEQIDWLKRYCDKINKEADMALSQPRTLPYPASAAGLVHAGPIGTGGVWWVRSILPGRPIEFGGSYSGYTIALPEGQATVLWSLRGPRETHLWVPDPRRVDITTPDRTPITPKINLKTKTVSFMMPDSPVIVRSGQDEVFPIEATEDALKQLRALLLNSEKLPVDQFKYQFNNALLSYHNNPKLAFVTAAEALNALGGMMQIYAWIEAEAAQPHNFSEVALNDAASGGSYLSLNTETVPRGQGYAAQLKFSVPKDDNYTIWISCTPPGANTSEFAWTLDATAQINQSRDAARVGEAYLDDRMMWLKLGRAQLKGGDHTLTLNVKDRAAATGRFALALDSLIVTRYSFKPNGIAKPDLAEISDTLDLKPLTDLKPPKLKKK
jgi:hypothetical protein